MRPGQSGRPPSRTRDDAYLAARKVRASFRHTTIRVYQAFPPEIADTAVAAQTFKPPFKRKRMTWIKPSFIWMMYRSGWATKAGQERILGIDILRSGFEWALAHSCLTGFDASVYGTLEDWQANLRSTPVRVQWDPERTLSLEPLGSRTIQVGLGCEAVDAYLDEWITNVEDVTTLAHEVELALRSGDSDHARSLLPVELPYPLPDDVARQIGCSPEAASRITI